MSKRSTLILSLAALASTVGLAGCNQTPPAAPPAAPAANAPVAEAKTAHGHSDWWCGEHGVPEEVCALCHPEVAAKMKAKEKWCQKHDRPDSQCFVCHPELEGKFAALYEAKYGQKPPKPTDTGVAEDDKNPAKTPAKEGKGA